MALASPATASAGWTEARKDDTGKARFDLLPPGPTVDVVRVLTFGAAKYGERNWETGLSYGRVYAALQRHLFAWWSGEDLDAETGLSHLAHAGCCLTFLLEYVNHSHAGQDDRPAPR